MKKLLTIKLEDKWQDFLELDILDNGIIKGNSIMFKKGRLSLLGVGTLDGKEYLTFNEIKKGKKPKKGYSIYMYDTEEKQSLPWEAKTLNYKIIL